MASLESEIHGKNGLSPCMKLCVLSFHVNGRNEEVRGRQGYFYKVRFIVYSPKAGSQVRENATIIEDVNIRGDMCHCNCHSHRISGSRNLPIFQKGIVEMELMVSN